jgi:hypothetical protein
MVECPPKPWLAPLASHCQWATGSFCSSLRSTVQPRLPCVGVRCGPALRHRLAAPSDQGRLGRVRSGQVYYSAEVQDHEGQAKKTSRANSTKVPAQMSNELESDTAMVVNLELFEPEGLAFVPPFLEGLGAFVCDQDLAPTVRIRDLNRRFGGLHVSPGLRFACCRRYRGASCCA